MLIREEFNNMIFHFGISCRTKRQDGISKTIKVRGKLAKRKGVTLTDFPQSRL